MSIELFSILSFFICIFSICGFIFYSTEDGKKLLGTTCLIPPILVAAFFMFAEDRKEIIDTQFSDVYTHENVAVGIFDEPVNLNKEMSRNFEEPATVKRETVVEWRGFAYYPERYEYTVVEDK